MRLVDCFLDVILYTRQFLRALPEQSPDYPTVREKIQLLLEESEHRAAQLAFAFEVKPTDYPEFFPSGNDEQRPLDHPVEFNSETFQAAKYGVVAFLDELILASAWEHKAAWRKFPLQREYFDTTNAGAGFYDRLNALAKFGPERPVREVYCLCLGLGFRGKYFAPEHRQQLEETKIFNLDLLLPEEAQRNLETATLFPSAYGGDREGRGSYKPRVNLVPFAIAVPAVVVVATAFLYHRWIVALLNRIAQLAT